MKCVCVCVYESLLYVGQYLSLWKRCLQCWAWLVYRKCSKKTVAECVGYLMSLLFSNRKRPGLSEVTMIVFVNQMLLMMAGDVERNPGPGNVNLNARYILESLNRHSYFNQNILVFIRQALQLDTGHSQDKNGRSDRLRVANGCTGLEHSG